MSPTTSRQRVSLEVTIQDFSDASRIIQVTDEIARDTPLEARHSPRLKTPGSSSNSQQPCRNISLNDELHDQAIKRPGQNASSYWPLTILEKILTVERITQELDKFALAHPKRFQKGDASLARKIGQHHRIVFALLCLCSKGACVLDCIEEKIEDEDLPLLVDEENGHSLSRKRSPTHIIRCFEESSMTGCSWERHERDYISSNQHRFLPAVFGLGTDGRTVQHMEFGINTVLPFMRQNNSQTVQEGGFGMVEQVQVHPDCHHFHDILPSIRTNNFFAMKRLKTESGTEHEREKNFRKEVLLLKRFSGFDHDHLVTLLVSWKIPCNETTGFCLLFPLARCDLDIYLEDRSLSMTTIPWISKQVLGLTDALRSMHEPPYQESLTVEGRKYGRHGDLKPSNILWYESPGDANGILVIADLGSSAVNSIWSRSAIDGGTVQSTPGYKPPECDLQGGTISRSYDIWTFGCILLELVCWCLKGPQGNRDFAQARLTPYLSGVCSDMFFDIKPTPNGKLVVLVKESVTKQMAQLHGNSDCSRYLHDLLYLIEEHMIVALSQSTSRISSTELHKQIEALHQRVLRDSEYYTEPCKTPRIAKLFDPVEAVFAPHRRIAIQERVQYNPTHDGKVQRSKTDIELSRVS